MNINILIFVALIYLLAIGYLGFRGFLATKSTADYMVAGRKIHPYVMALSYGATFISTSAIVGFGGAAALFGMGLLWLTFLNIFVGIFIAFVVFGPRTRQMGHRLQAHTFPELIGRRFQSRFIQGFSGLIILLFMPLYAAAVLIGAARYIENTFMPGQFEIAVAIFSILIAAYVVAGGLKGVMYTDALQGSLMFIGMLLLIVFAYSSAGGVVTAHRELDALPQKIEQDAAALVSEVRGVVPAEIPDEQAGDWFIGNAVKLKGDLEGKTDEEKGAYLAENPEMAAIAGFMKQNPDFGKRPAFVNRAFSLGVGKAGWQGWARMPKGGSNFFYVLVTSIIMGVGIGVLAQPQLAVRFMTVKSTRELNRAILVGGIFILTMTGVAFVVGNLSNLWFTGPEHGGLVSFMAAGKNIDKVMPEFINQALPTWFGALFMLTLLSAAMSTLSSQFHAMGTSIGRDFFEKGMLGREEDKRTVLVTRLGVILGILATVVLSLYLPGGIVAAATAIFFGLCASSFLPMFIGALFWKRMTKAGAVASLCAGFGVSFFWLMFVQQAKGKLPAILANWLLGVPTILPEPVFGIHWNWLEALFVGLPISAITAVVVSLMTQPPSREHLDLCFKGVGAEPGQ